jgi:hypothetical protein
MHIYTKKTLHDCFSYAETDADSCRQLDDVRSHNDDACLCMKNYHLEEMFERVWIA